MKNDKILDALFHLVSSANFIDTILIKHGDHFSKNDIEWANDIVKTTREMVKNGILSGGLDETENKRNPS